MRTRPSLAVAFLFVGCAPASAPVAVPVPVAAVPAEPPLTPDLDLFAPPTDEEQLLRRESDTARTLAAAARHALERPMSPPLTPREADAVRRAIELVEAYDYEAAFGWLSALHALRKPMPPAVIEMSARLGEAITAPTRRITLRYDRDPPSSARAAARVRVRLIDELARARFDSEWLEDHKLAWVAKPAGWRTSSAGRPTQTFKLPIRSLEYRDVWIGVSASWVEVRRSGNRVAVTVDLGRIGAHAAVSSWAEIQDELLFVSVAGANAADAAHGVLVAVDLGRPGGLRWRSRSRACTTRAFAVTSRFIVCGGEDGKGRPAIVVVDRDTGVVATEAEVEDPPRAVLTAADRVFVRGERRDLEVVIEAAKP